MVCSFVVKLRGVRAPHSSLRSGTEASHFDAGFISDFPTLGRTTILIEHRLKDPQSFCRQADAEPKIWISIAAGRFVGFPFL
jgi:hypothetical protein